MAKYCASLLINDYTSTLTPQFLLISLRTISCRSTVRSAAWLSTKAQCSRVVAFCSDRLKVMVLWIIVSTLVVGVVIAVYAFKSMRPVDRVSLVMKILLKSGIWTLLVRTGFNERMRPTPIEIIAPNGFKMMVPTVFFSAALEPVLAFKTRDDDVFLATFPKAGTTWIQEITWLICNNADTAAAKREALTARSPFLETSDLDDNHKGLQALETWPIGKQRVIKTHLPFEVLPEEVTVGKKGKIICVARNPKDLCVSYYHFHLMNSGMPAAGNWSEFLTKFCSGELSGGSWFPHTLKYWEEYQNNEYRLYFTTYEALKTDLCSEVASIAKFLGKELTEKQIDTIADHCTFDSMSKNKQTNYSNAQKFGLNFKKSKFMRKGKVGDWKNYFTLNENVAFDEMYKEKMKGSGLTFSFEL